MINMIKVYKAFAAVFVIVCMAIYIDFGQIHISAQQYAGNITLKCEYAGVPLKDMEWNVYKAADISDSGFIISDKFSQFPVVFDTSSQEKTKNLAFTLQSYVLALKPVPDRTLKTSSDGTAVFDNLEKGCYLAVSGTVVSDDTVYYASPVLVNIPDTDGSESSVLSVPKTESVKLHQDSFDMNITVEHKWQKPSESSEVTVILIKDGTEYDRAVLNKDNDWSYTWGHVPEDGRWTVIKVNPDKNWTVSYELDTRTDGSTKNCRFIILSDTDIPQAESGSETGETVPESESTGPANDSYISGSLPQTGQLWWPVPVLSFLGTAVFASGWYLYNKDHKKS